MLSGISGMQSRARCPHRAERVSCWPWRREDTPALPPGPQPKLAIRLKENLRCVTRTCSYVAKNGLAGNNSASYCGGNLGGFRVGQIASAQIGFPAERSLWV